MSDASNLPPSPLVRAGRTGAVLDPAQVRSPEQLIDDLSRFLSHAGNDARQDEQRRPGTEPPHAQAYSIDDDEFDDAPMPIPSTWRQTEPSSDERGWFAEQTWAAVLGFVVGLAIIVPAVLFATARFGALDVAPERAGGVDRAPVIEARDREATRAGAGPVSSQFVQGASALSISGRVAPSGAKGTVNAAAGLEKGRYAEPPPEIAAGTAPEARVIPRGAEAPASPAAEPETAVATVPSLKPLTQMLPTLEAARARVASGDVVGGRKLLAQLASSGDAPAMFLLAETYDPNILAAWAMQGVAADVGKARLFYAMALSQGPEMARGRLSALD